MSEHTWLVLASISPLVLGAVLPIVLAWARRSQIRAREARREVLGLKQTLTEAQKMELLGAMVAGLVHDLNNVSMAVMGNLDLVLMFDAKLEPATRRSIEAARIAADKGLEVMRSVLRFSRADHAKTEVDVRQVLHEAEGVLRLLIPRGIELTISVPRCSVKLELDRVQFFQLVLNLVVNARDAMVERGTGSILVDLDLDLDGVILKVVDSGCGIPEDVLPRIFDWRFTTKGEGRGTGLGLGIVQEAVNALQGRIEVTSQVGVGTTFTILLPRT